MKRKKSKKTRTKTKKTRPRKKAKKTKPRKQFKKSTYKRKKKLKIRKKVKKNIFTFKIGDREISADKIACLTFFSHFYRCLDFYKLFID